MENSRNPYIEKGNSPTLKLSVVAFVDILGYRDLVIESAQNGTEQEFLQKLHNALSEATKSIYPHKNELLRKFLKEDNHAVRAFTDNIVIGYPIKGKGDAEVELGMIFSHLSYYQMIMIINGFFVRGGIGIGNLYMDDTVVYGQGLIDAYNAEQSLARDPRIVLNKSAKDAVEKHLEYYGRTKSAPQVSYFYKDSDGQFFLNYLDTIIPESGNVYKKELETHKNIIEKKLIEYENNPVLWSKYLWVANYHNFYCSQQNEINDTFMIDLDRFKLSPALIVD
jgi:hypothetical protein